MATSIFMPEMTNLQVREYLEAGGRQVIVKQHMQQGDPRGDRSLYFGNEDDRPGISTTTCHHYLLLTHDSILGTNERTIALDTGLELA